MQQIKSSTLSEDAKAEIQEAFNMFDKDGDGHLTKVELRGVMKNLGQNFTDSELNEIMSTMDLDKNGTIEFNEFLAMMGKKSMDTTDEEELRRAFRVFDDDDSGEIVISELRETFRKLGQNITDEELRDIVSEVDDDGDGTISFQEFVHIMTYK
mmetsp:Transcript_10882/g.14158  ORF Transcript_10882/g.14158 Transcript_10882/m.14158 type:complete len:154 (-) Transcript_10882:70-531(-)|eukprot:CAMPEP_0117755928 /NCGR_PEP_ID=MMETSP0947-20121206/13750_1 /TAXON_ID=44440 /ORGANISM="Chattonella subsalsa, Strain CCMP2191" /LENGTH=153 /DNA_ID=CAMNT_0005575369 /DNA_START=94 /DNA_END=555 /DNA_ORIENTATION=-